MSNSKTGAGMHPKPTKQQRSAQHDASDQTVAKRKHASSQGAQTWATEYQERFLAPFYDKNNPNHQVNGKRNDVVTFRPFCVTHKWTKNPPKAPSPSVPPKGRRRYNNAEYRLSEENKMDFTTMYNQDFQVWKTNRRLPFKQKDSLKVKQGLAVPDSASKEEGDEQKSVPVEQKPTPIESITTYKADYVPCEVLSRPHRVKLTNRGQRLEAVVSSKPTAAKDINQEPPNETDEFLHQLKIWSLETKSHARSPNQPDRHFNSNTPGDDTYQDTEPIQPSTQPSEGKKGMTTTEDCRVRDAPQRITTAHTKEPERPIKTTFSVHKHKPGKSRTTKPKTSSWHPKITESAVRDYSCKATEVFSGSGYSTGSRETRMPWLEGNSCKKSPQTHRTVSCLVSCKSQGFPKTNHCYSVVLPRHLMQRLPLQQ